MLGLGHLALKESFNVRLTLTVLLIAFSQLNFGLDQQGFSATQAMDSFERQFGQYDAKKGWYLPTVWLSYFNGFHYIGQAAGVIIGSYVSNHWGRRMCMFSMSIWAIVAATIVITAKSSNQILAGRCLNYIYIGMELAVVPIYQSEVTPRKARGFVVGTYQLSLYVGGLIINCIARGTSTIQTNAAWRIIYGMFYVVPSIVAATVWFVPESPRWLALQDRPEEALASLKLLREGKFTDEEIEAELHTILTNYGAIFVKSLGTVNPFTVTVIIAVVNCLTAFGAMVLVDRMGRRFMILAGACIQVAGLYTMGGLGTVSNPSHGIKSGIISMMVIFSFGYSFGWAPMAHTLSAEIPSAKLRDLTYRSASVLNIATQFTVSFSLPYLLNAPYANLKSKVGFIFGTVCFISLFFTYLLVPDCAGKSLEEVDYLFERKISARKFRETKVDLQSEALDDVNAKSQSEHFDKA